MTHYFKCDRPSYKINIDIEQTVEERDLGVLIDNQLKFHDHSSMAAGKARRLLGLISKCFINLTPLTFSCLYNTIVRPILEYGNIACMGPNYKLDEDLVEKVQRKATKLVPSIRHLPYKERLWCLRLPSLQYRRLHGDMMMTYNILHGYLDIDESIFFVRSWNSTRGHPFKLFKPAAIREVRQKFYSKRVITNWNALPSYIVEANSVNSFKAMLDDHYKDTIYFYD